MDAQLVAGLQARRLLAAGLAPVAAKADGYNIPKSVKTDPETL
jgi:hypothetical protein